MKIDRLIYFAEAASLQNFHHAAASLRISVSSIVHAVRSLEEEFETKLFFKSGRQIHLTSDGLRLVAEVREVLDKLRSMEALFERKTGFSGYVRIGCPPLILEKFLEPAVAELGKANPEATFELCSLSSSEVQRQVIDHRLDFGFCLSPEKTPLLRMEVLYGGQLKICLQRKHPLKSARRLQELSRYPCALPPSRTSVESCLEHPMFKKFCILPRPQMLFDSYALALQALRRNSLLWSLIPDLLLIDAKDVRTLTPQRGWIAPYVLAMVQRREKHDHPISVALKEKLLKFLNSLR